MRYRVSACMCNPFPEPPTAHFPTVPNMVSHPWQNRELEVSQEGVNFGCEEGVTWDEWVKFGCVLEVLEAVSKSTLALSFRCKAWLLDSKSGGVASPIHACFPNRRKVGEPWMLTAA